jgi:DNA repair exonuclease SbcCD ATPase subunit
LIKARQNIRQMLSRSSSSASATRKFDQQQRQKLRTPPKKDDKADQAKLQQELEKLAQEEKKIAQEIEAKNGGAQAEQKGQESPKGSNSSKSKSDGTADGSSSGKGKPSESKPSLGERQDKAAAKAEELKQLVRKNEKLTELARERMDKAAEEVRSSADSLKQGRDGEAGKQAADAAEQLERLAKQVAALTAPEVVTRLAHGQNMARQLSREQEAIEKQLRDRKGGGQQAAKERGLSEEARTVADLLKKLQPDAEAANAQLGRDLRQATEANSPSAAAEQMRRAADALQAGKIDQAARDVNGSGRSLNELAQQLDAARRAAVQPQLEKLLAAEKQAAETKKTLDGVNNDRQKTEAEKKVADLRDTLNGIKNADGKLAEATDALDQAIRGGNPSAWQKREPHDPRLGAYVPPHEYDDNIRRAIQALQAKIQDIILKDILLDKDEPVPPQYKALVEEYYRVLSDDAR